MVLLLTGALKLLFTLLNSSAEIALREAKIQQLESQLMNGHANATPAEQAEKSEAATDQQQHQASSHELELVQVRLQIHFLVFFSW